MNVLYIVLLLAGAIGFGLHLYAQYRFARLMRTRYPKQWNIVAKPERGKPSGMRTWARLQHVLRSEAPMMFEDAELTRWHRMWRFAPLLAWPCWIGALALQVAMHR
ncbi:hypothetical protein HBF24_00910 [Oleiagrimonas sp. C23AA]|nr:hypothetical protein [Oleiagrimonas sp. C23AA]NII09240.1 hypothetical protein [Oleiagrimonas sp. C23AA]